MKTTPTNPLQPGTTLESRARELYLRASRDVDPAAAARLRAARRAALDAAEGPRTLRWMMPAGAGAVIALAVVMVWQPLRRTAPMATPTAIGSDLDAYLPPDADSADPALYQNLDFYAWLAQQPAAKRPAGG